MNKRIQAVLLFLLILFSTELSICFAFNPDNELRHFNHLFNKQENIINPEEQYERTPSQIEDIEIEASSEETIIHYLENNEIQVTVGP